MGEWGSGEAGQSEPQILELHSWDQGRVNLDSLNGRLIPLTTAVVVRLTLVAEQGCKIGHNSLNQPVVFSKVDSDPDCGRKPRTRLHAHSCA